MKKIASICILLICQLVVSAQYKIDNVVYQTVFLEDFCRELKNYPDHLLLDVRSKGEHDDTSAMHHLNIGHLEGATNMDVRQISVRWRELLPYQDKTIFVYCSHSQRSRRASKMLVDSEFKNVINVNGGLTGFHLIEDEIACAKLLQLNLPYQFYSPAQLCSAIRLNNTIIIDIRSDSAFIGISADEGQNVQGNLKDAMNIPLALLPTQLSSIPKNKDVVLVDEFGDDSPEAATLLLKSGYPSVHILFNGMKWICFYPG